MLSFDYAVKESSDEEEVDIDKLGFNSDDATSDSCSYGE